ncbi:hypothetical protein CFC21_053109 [Triticum aestivum]|uniref:GUN4-like domain-containing protein n=3 Tax=Triticum TaxID=4564 RepID=A0A9R0W2C5_TRITD|nr:hypothetical protein CFC21_053109 [Triticum aestivum]VAH94183.1 unnamed protein product [Triticum turgidum subsp. durum]
MHPYKTTEIHNFSQHRGRAHRHRQAVDHAPTASASGLPSRTAATTKCNQSPDKTPSTPLSAFPSLSSAPLHPSSAASSPAGQPAMANASLQSFLPQHHHSFLSSATHDGSPPALLKLTTTTASNSISFKLFASGSSSVTTTANSPAPTPAATTSPPTPSLELLGQQLAAGDYRQADETTRALLIVLAGEAARRRGYVFFSEVQFISVEDLRAVDALWLEHSGGRIGWMKKLDTEVEQFNYRAFPDEFIWELTDDTPEGHLPLTNALRGTRLLENIFTHPAFDCEEEEAAAADEEAGTGSATGQNNKDDKKSRGRSKSLTDFKPDYSF